MAERARRVFVSHTSELRRYPRDRSFIAAAEAAITRAGHVVTDMAYFTARSDHTSEYCQRMVAGADVYVGVIGLRYGSPVSDRPEVSYTELEFESATRLALPRLVFLLDEDAELPLPASQIADLVHGRRQAAFRRRLRETSLAVGTVASPAELETRLYQALVELAAAGEEQPAPAGGPAGGSVALPLGRLPVEVRGRDELLSFLEQARGLVVLAGMGGAGKSTVATELGRRLRPDRPVWWVSAADAPTMAAGMVTLARRLGGSPADVDAVASHAGDGPDRLWALLDRVPEGWLLVLDNADQPDLLLPSAASVADGAGWFRAGDRGLVLVTSRQTGPLTWGRQARVERLGPLSDAASAQVLLDLAPHAGGHDQAEALGRRLGGLPLALFLAGSHLGSGITRLSSFATYRGALERETAAVRLLEPDPDTALADDPRATLTSTWELSLDDLARRGLPDARAVLRLLSCFAPAVPIAIDLLDPRRLAALLSAGPEGAHLEQTLRGLARLGLIEAIAGQGAVVVHPVICAINRAHLRAAAGPRDPDPGLVRETAAGLLVAAIRGLRADEPADWPRFRTVPHHVLALLRETAPFLRDEQTAALLDASNAVAFTFHQLGAVSAAMDLTRAAISCGQRLGSRHPTVLRARSHLALELRWQGQLAQAEAVLRELLDVERTALGDDDPVTLMTRRQLALTAFSRGRYREAEAAFRHVLEDQRRVLGPDDLDALQVQQDLARVLVRLGRPAEAERLLREVLDVERRALGGDHPDISETRHRLARAIAERGRPAEAEAIFREVLDTRRRRLGERHHLTLSTRVGLARSLADQGRSHEAEAMLREVVDDRRELLGDDHPSTLATRHYLALAMADVGRWTEAEAMLASVADVRRRTLGDEHPGTLSSRHALAVAIARQGRWSQARPIMAETLAARRRTLGDGHPDTLTTLAMLEEAAAAELVDG